MTRFKGWRTWIVNIVAGLPLLIDVMLPVIAEIAGLQEVRDIIPTSWLPYYSLALALINIALRAVTTTPLGQKTP